jgi:hypothetical protein
MREPRLNPDLIAAARIPGALAGFGYDAPKLDAIYYQLKRHSEGLGVTRDSTGHMFLPVAELPTVARLLGLAIVPAPLVQKHTAQYSEADVVEAFEGISPLHRRLRAAAAEIIQSGMFGAAPFSECQTDDIHGLAFAQCEQDNPEFSELWTEFGLASYRAMWVELDEAKAA